MTLGQTEDGGLQEIIFESLENWRTNFNKKTIKMLSFNHVYAFKEQCIKQLLPRGWSLGSVSDGVGPGSGDPEKENCWPTPKGLSLKTGTMGLVLGADPWGSARHPCRSRLRSMQGPD